jgi:hypothetical protein
MDPQLLQLIVGGVLEVVRRHHAETGEILTDEAVHAALTAELESGQGAIATWFASKGLPPPQ